jgi:hypothetical protein
MKLIAIAFTTAGLFAAAGSASAAASDVEFMKANRCRGLAASGIMEVDTAAMDAFIKAERGARNAYIAQRAQAEYDKAKREGKTDSADRKAKLTAELTGPCQAFKA